MMLNKPIQKKQPKTMQKESKGNKFSGIHKTTDTHRIQYCHQLSSPSIKKRLKSVHYLDQGNHNKNIIQKTRTQIENVLDTIDKDNYRIQSHKFLRKLNKKRCYPIMLRKAEQSKEHFLNSIDTIIQTATPQKDNKQKKYIDQQKQLNHQFPILSQKRNKINKSLILQLTQSYLNRYQSEMSKSVEKSILLEKIVRNNKRQSYSRCSILRNRSIKQSKKDNIKMKKPQIAQRLRINETLIKPWRSSFELRQDNTIIMTNK